MSKFSKSIFQLHMCNNLDFFLFAGSSPRTEVLTQDQQSIVSDHVTDQVESSLDDDCRIVLSSSVSIADCLNASTKKGMDCHMESHAVRLGHGVRFSGPVGLSPRSTFEAVSSQYNPFAYRDLGLHVSSQSAYFPKPFNGELPLEATPFPRGCDAAGHGYDSVSDGIITPASTVRRFTPPDMLGRVSVTESVMAASRTPSFRRTPGARRPNVSSASRSFTYQCPPLLPKPLFTPSLTNNACSRIPCEYVAGGESHGVGRRFPTPHWDQLPVARSDSQGSVTPGVELVVSNLDYNISMHEWKKILQSELQQQVQVRVVLMIAVFWYGEKRVSGVLLLRYT